MHVWYVIIWYFTVVCVCMWLLKLLSSKANVSCCASNLQSESLLMPFRVLINLITLYVLWSNILCSVSLHLKISRIQRWEKSRAAYLIFSSVWEVGHVPSRLQRISWFQSPDWRVPLIWEQLLVRVNDDAHERSGFKLISKQHFLTGSNY